MRVIGAAGIMSPLPSKSYRFKVLINYISLLLELIQSLFIKLQPPFRIKRYQVHQEWDDGWFVALEVTGPALRQCSQRLSLGHHDQGGIKKKNLLGEFYVIAENWGSRKEL
ncbi:uncharacterized protein LOC113326604 [Papaver somniferum]|uniref:uncharacterized protein LOC113326604 n=1 Tax=Papaver somniferum TaxID=3469 RepID=UPI000E702949|nr:uncharacterized protein LOC113326604 [Papaver somniferum]